jgi:type II secretory pathway component PulM
MSPREKNLLLFFAAAGFLVVNFLGFKFYQDKKLQVERQHAHALRKLDAAEAMQAKRDEITDEMEWLTKNEPEPAANQDVQTNLQKLCETEAKNAGLSIKTQKPLPTETGAHYHRAKIQLTVNGTEEALYRWFDRLNIPEKLRVASSIRVSPNTQDDTKIDCAATIEQWFVPLPQS